MRFASDENFDGRILAGLLKRISNFDVVRIQDTEMYQKPDPQLLDWLADKNRILITHDVRTIPAYVYDRVQAGRSVPGVIEVSRSKLSIGQAIDQLELMIGASTSDEFSNQVRFIPIV